MQLTFFLAVPGLFALTPRAALAEGAAQPLSATYTITFDATWSAETHPIDFPPNPHFSGLIGGTHNDLVAFWEVGQLASLGIKNMAELGQKTALQAEVEAEITAGNAGEVISGGAIFPSPGSVSTSFTVTQDFPLATIVCMIAPSPDWFVGVSGVSLFQAGDWVTTLVVDLLPYDAGTDSGVNYTSPNTPTIPPEPIFLKTDGPFVGGVPLGTFTFTLDPTSVTPTAPDLGLRNYPNPFNPSTTVSFHLPDRGHLSVGVYDLRGELVSLLLDGIVEAGDRSVVWNGRNRGGRSVPAGTYLVKVAGLGHNEVRKISLVK